jgi:hypothetical protein
VRRSEAEPSRAAVEAPNSPRRSGLAIGRRAFLVLGPAGIAGTALAACGDEIEEPSTERDVELLSDALVGEENTTSALGIAERESSGSEATELRALREQASANATRLQDELAKLDATPEGEFEIERGADAKAALDRAIEETNRALGAYRLGAGQLSTEGLRATAIELMTGDGARLALLRAHVGKDEAPFAFVTGGPEPPHQSTDTEDDSSDGQDGGETTTTEDESSG